MTSEPGQPDAPQPETEPKTGADSAPDKTPDKVSSALNKLNNTEKKAQAKAAFTLAQALFERGRYKRAIAQFKIALSLSNPMGARGGEIQLWLVNAYVAADELPTGLALCRKLILHPDLETQRQSKRLLYILEAPELEMRPEWVTQIPDLTDLEDDRGKRYRQTPKSPRPRKPKPAPEPLDLSQVDTDDNAFVWIALAAVAAILGGLVWFS
ncbi:MAG: hypothetical protein WBC73_14200 [Phormidesmis sp.]